MATWAGRRKFAYISSFLFAYFIVISAVYFVYFYKAPTCFDNKMNGSETGIDCGGSCTRLCNRDNIDPIIHWSRAFQVSTSTYNLLAYVENPNVNASVAQIGYTFRAFNAQGVEIYHKNGTTFIPAGKIFGVFEGPIVFASGTPKTLTFDFDKDITWVRGVQQNTALKATRIRLTREQPTPRVDASLENTSLDPIGSVEAVAIIYDEDGNAFAVSRTFADSIPKESSQDIVFTWPRPFAEQFASCEVPADIALVIDRSGSMSSDGTDPPEPLTTTKKAAESFVDALGKNGRVAVVSFATKVSNDQALTASSTVAKAVLDAISIHTDGLQQTNIGDALNSALSIFPTAASSTDATHHAVILLTDGIPTEPTKPKEKEYPKTYATQKGLELAGKGIDLYTIGLGKDIDETFLRDLASDPTFFFKAPTSADLAGIYGHIAASLCKKNPVIEVLPRIYPAQ